MIDFGISEDLIKETEQIKFYAVFFASTVISLVVCEWIAGRILMAIKANRLKVISFFAILHGFIAL